MSVYEEYEEQSEGPTLRDLALWFAAIVCAALQVAVQFTLTLAFAGMGFAVLNNGPALSQPQLEGLKLGVAGCVFAWVCWQFSSIVVDRAVDWWRDRVASRLVPVEEGE